jgi:hypothetical protein
MSTRHDNLMYERREYAGQAITKSNSFHSYKYKTVRLKRRCKYKSMWRIGQESLSVLYSFFLLSLSLSSFQFGRIIVLRTIRRKYIRV